MNNQINITKESINNLILEIQKIPLYFWSFGILPKNFPTKPILFSERFINYCFQSNEVSNFQNIPTVFSSAIFRKTNMEKFINDIFKEKLEKNLFNELNFWKSTAWANWSYLSSCDSTIKTFPHQMSSELFRININKNSLTTSGCDIERNGLILEENNQTLFLNKLIIYNQNLPNNFDIYLDENNELLFAENFSNFKDIDNKNLFFNFVLPTTTGELIVKKSNNPNFNYFSELLTKVYYEPLQNKIIKEQIEKYFLLAQKDPKYFARVQFFFSAITINKVLNNQVLTSEEKFKLIKVYNLNFFKNEILILEQKLNTAEQANSSIYNNIININKTFDYVRFDFLIDLLIESKYQKHCIGDFSAAYFYSEMVNNHFNSSNSSAPIILAGIYKNQKPFITFMINTALPLSGEFKGVYNSLFKINSHPTKPNEITLEEFNLIKQAIINNNKPSVSKSILNFFIKNHDLDLINNFN